MVKMDWNQGAESRSYQANSIISYQLQTREFVARTISTFTIKFGNSSYFQVDLARRSYTRPSKKQLSMRMHSFYCIDIIYNN